MSKKLVPMCCPLCKSRDVHAYKVGWAVIHCRKCRLSLSQQVPLNELIERWNNRRGKKVERIAQTSLF